MSNYFNKRLIDLLKADIKRSKRLEKNIRSGYKLAKGLIEADIEKYTSRIADVLELDLNKLNKKLSIEDMKVLAQSLGVSDDFYASYANLSYMEAIRLEMAKSIRKLADDNESLIYDHLAATFENNYYTTCYELYKTMDDFTFKKRVTTEYFDFLAKKPWTADGKTFSQKIWSNQERLINELSREFVVSATRGANIKESAKRLSQRMDIDYKRCVRLLNTEDSFFSNQAVLEAYKNTTSEQYRILATLDSRTCDVCGSVDLKVFNIKDAKAGINLPPFHPNCRCTTTIYFEDDEEADERIMRDKDGKSVKDKFMSYDEWKKKYVDKVDKDENPKPKSEEKPKDKVSKILKDDKPTQEELDAVEYYVSGDGMYINDYLRDRNNPVERMGEMTDFDKETIKHLESATDREHGYDKLYRCVDADAIFDNVSDMDWEYIQGNLGYGQNNQRAKEMIDSVKDKVITDKGFMSTTKDYDIAADFLDFTGADHPLVIEFEDAKNVKGFDLEKFMPDLDSRMEQKEVLLHNNTSYKIKDIIMDERGRIKVKAEFINVEEIASNTTKEGIIDISKIEYKEAKTIKEANKFAESIGFEADYKGINIKCANEWNKGLYDMKTKYPEITDDIRFVGSTQARNKKMREAATEFYKGYYKEMGFDDDIVAALAKKKGNGIINNVEVDETASSISSKHLRGLANQDLAKALEDCKGITINKSKFNNYENVIKIGNRQVEIKYWPEACNNVKSTFDHEFAHQIDDYLGVRNNEEIIKLFNENTKDKIKDGLSEYAGTNIGEFIAEAWREYCNNPKPREMATKVGKVVEKLWEAKK